MFTTPNFDIVQEALQALEKEYDLEKSLAKYPSIMPELVQFMSDQGLYDEKDASRALFVSDYILTSSEVSYGISDEERRQDISKMFMQGLKRGSSDILLKVYFLANKTNSMIRRSDNFMAGRGVLRKASLIMIKDIFLDPYLEVCSKLLGEGPCGWELSVLAGAMKKTLPGTEFEQFKEAPSKNKHGELLKYLWKLLLEYNDIANTEVNDQVVIPNIETSSTLLGFKSQKKKTYFSSWNINTLPDQPKENKQILTDLNEFLSQSDDAKPFVYLRGKILTTEDNLFVIRNPYQDTKPFFILKSPVDEVNVTELLTLLNNRGQDLANNPEVMPMEKIEKYFMEEFDKEEVVEKEVEVEREVEVEEEVDIDPTPASELPEKMPKPAKQKKGFLSKLMFWKKDSSETTSVQTKREDKPTTKRKEKVKKKVKGTEVVQEKKIVKDKRRVKKELEPSSNLPDFLGYALGMVGVGDLNLFEIFDTIRESNYVFSGVLHSDLKNNKSTFYASKGITDPKSLTKILDGLDLKLELVFKHFYDKNIQIQPGEILFTGARGETKFILEFEGNEDHLVGIMATTYFEDESTFPKVEVETFQRRTLKMRTKQLLTTLKSVPRFDEAFSRVLGEELLKKCQELTFDEAILSIYK